jgi:2'-hydroxyisoflavone reductase
MAAGRLSLAARPLAVLILGGTGFVGPHVVEQALARGHRVTLFNRGRSGAGPFAGRVESLVGDRDPGIGAGLGALSGARTWDAVIDISGYLPRHVRASAALLEGRVGRYLYVSTMGVYDRSRAGSVTEQSPMLELVDPGNEDYSGPRYGPQKAEADRIVQGLYGTAATSVRPTFILGPGDDTDRFSYWIDRVAAGGEVLGPRADAAPLQWVDVRDLSAWIVDLCERNQHGAFNAAAPPVPWDGVLDTLRPFASGPVMLRRPAGAVVDTLKIAQPLVRPDNPVVRLDGTLATRHGLAYRPLAETAQAAYAWWRSLPAERRARAAARWPTAEQEKAGWQRAAVSANPS